jgi:hypothetical protein
LTVAWPIELLHFVASLSLMAGGLTGGVEVETDGEVVHGWEDVAVWVGKSAETPKDGMLILSGLADRWDPAQWSQRPTFTNS